MKHLKNRLSKWLLLVLIAALAAGCTPAPSPTDTSSVLKVTATTSIVADIVSQVGGEHVQVTTLVPIGTDVHQYQPTPQDVANVSKANIVFENGLGLEQFMDKIVQNASIADRIVVVSDGITPIEFSGGTEDADTEGLTGDPHVWFDPENVKVWVKNIETTLIKADPTHEQNYAKNAQKTLDTLTSLDEWIKSQVALIPVDSRKIITDHLIFGYFTARYGLEQVGAIVPSYSSAAESSAQDLAALEDTIGSLHVKAIFLGQNVNPTLAQRVAEDTGVKLVQIYTGSLTTSDGPAPTYQDYMRYNVTAVVKGLTGAE